MEPSGSYPGPEVARMGEAVTWGVQLQDGRIVLAVKVIS